MNGKLFVSTCVLAVAPSFGIACGDEPKVVPPPPLPSVSTTVPAAAPVPATPVAAHAKAPAHHAQHEKASPHPAAAHVAKTSSQPAPRATSKPSASTPPALPSPSAPIAVAPPAAPAPPAAVAPAPAATKHVQVPSTPNVRVELPSGLQADLDADPRMQAWVNRVIAIADGCHAKNRSVQGTLQALITMHENDRPDADLQGMPGQLSGIVACATSALLSGNRMPLFTGREGTRYTVRMLFSAS
jgi:hypothetical protein